MKSQHLPYSDRSSISKSPLDPPEESQEKHLLFPDQNKQQQQKKRHKRLAPYVIWGIHHGMQCSQLKYRPSQVNHLLIYGKNQIISVHLKRTA